MDAVNIPVVLDQNYLLRLRVLYLDPDILAINPLRDLRETDPRGTLSAAAHTGKTEPVNHVN